MDVLLVVDDIVTTAQAANHCRVSRNLIDYWRVKGKLEPIGRIGRSWLYRLSDVAALELEMRDSPLSRRANPVIDGTEAA